MPGVERRTEFNNLLSFCKLIKLKWGATEKEIIRKFSEVILLIKKYIQADGAEFFYVQNDTLVRIDGVEESDPFTGNVKYEIGREEIVAAHTANHKETILVTPHNRAMKSTKFPKGIGRGVQIPEQVLSIPVFSAEGNCLAIFEFYRVRRPFEIIEISAGKCLVGWLGRSVNRRPWKELAENTTFRKWADDLSSFLSQQTPLLGHFLSRALRVLQKKTRAKVINFYEINHEKYYMYGQVRPGVFMKNNREFLLETNPFFEAVITRHKAVKVDEKNIIKFLQFDKIHLKDDKYLAQPIQSYLCVPVGKPSKTLGIIELLNKKEEVNFTESDIEFSVHCGRICCSAILLDKKNIKTTEAIHMARSQTAAIMNNIAACPHRFDTFYQKLKEIQIPNNFDQFSFYPSLENLKYLEQYSFYIFQEVFNIQDPYDSRGSRYVDFIITMEKGYRTNPYHNFEHGFNVCHIMFLMTRLNKKLFTDTEIQALIVASLGHDVDHPGSSNKWIFHSKNPLAQCYDSAYLENHHSNLCRLVAQTTGIFSGLKAEDYKSVMDFIHKAIIFTDRSNGIECRFRISHLLDSNEFSIINKSHRDYLFGLMMTTADLGGQAKRFDVNFRLCQHLYKEFSAERKKCLQLGYEPPWLRHTASQSNIPQHQINFNNDVCIPCFTTLSTILDGLKPLYQNCRELNHIWDSIKKQDIDWTKFDEESSYKCEDS